MKQSSNNIICFILFLCLTNSNHLKAQFQIEGIVSNNNQLLANVSICLTKSQKILSYTISNIQGKYQLTIPENYEKDDSVYVQFTCIGFQKKLLNINKAVRVYNIQLETATATLPDVIIKSIVKITVNHDTITYSVDAFAQKQDRKIGDVIKKIPGIEVLGNGKILYNGKAISNFYIDGDDILGDRYNIASNSIPVDMVDKIQMLENHQPIKALKSIRASDDVALNIKLKNTAKLKLHGTSEFAAGVPDKYDATINTLGFLKKQKFINVAKANNIGTDIKTEITQLNYKDYLNRIEKEEVSRLLFPQINYLTPVNKNRYFNNNSLLVSFNNLINLKKDVQLRTNLFYLPENQKFIQKNSTNVFLQNDTIRYVENQSSKSKEQQFTGDFQLNINKPNFYLNNKLTYQSSKSGINSIIERSRDTILQYYKDNRTIFANDFTILKVIKGKHIVDFFSYFSNTTQPEKSEWQQGLYAEILNNSIKYLSTKQYVKLPTFFTNNYFSYGKRITRYFIQTYKIGVAYQYQKLASNINLLQNNSVYTNAADSFVNNFSWQKTKAYFILGNDWNKEKLKINFRIPVNYFHFKLQNSVTDKFVVNPILSIKYNVGIENSLSLQASSNKYFGNIQSLYQGYIIQNYRSVASNNGLLTEQNNKNISIGFSYRRSVKIIFANILAGYNVINLNSISANEINSAIDRKILLPLNNTQKTWFVNMGISKYLFNVGTTAGMQFNFQKGTQYQLINNNLQSFNSSTINFSVSLSYNKSKWFNLNYKPNLVSSSSRANQAKSLPAAMQRLTIIQLQQSFDFAFYPTNNFIVKLTADQFYNNNKVTGSKSNIYFADISVRYKLKKLRTDVEFICTNIFNKRELINLVLFSNSFVESNISLNPRILLAKVVFTF